MSTNAGIVAQVRSALKLTSVDVALTDRAILATARNLRNKFVHQKLRRRIGWNSPNLFTPLRVNLEEVPIADFCDFQSDCTLSRSIHKLPQLGEGIFGLATQGAYSMDGKRRFLEMSMSRYQNSLAMDLPHREVFYGFFNGYLWTSDPMLEALILPVVLEGDLPQEFSLDCEVAGGGCPENPLHQPFRCFGDGMEGDVVTATAQFYTQYYKRAQADPSSNDQDESK